MTRSEAAAILTVIRDQMLAGAEIADVAMAMDAMVDRLESDAALAQKEDFECATGLIVPIH